MVELLISLAIMAMLLTSVAAAFHGAFETVEENQKVATVTQNARIILNRMMAEARRADGVYCDGSLVVILPPLYGSVEMTEFELVDDTLYYRQTIGGARQTHPILSPDDGVTIHGFSITYPPGSPLVQGLYRVDVLSAALDLGVDGNRFLVTASTNPRRGMEW